MKHIKKQFIHVCCLFLLEHHLWTRHGHEYILSYSVLAVLPRHTLSVCALWRPRGRKWNVDSAILFVQVLAFGRCLSTVTHMSSRWRRGRRPAMMVNDAPLTTTHDHTRPECSCGRGMPSSFRCTRRFKSNGAIK